MFQLLAPSTRIPLPTFFLVCPRRWDLLRAPDSQISARRRSSTRYVWGRRRKYLRFRFPFFATFELPPLLATTSRRHAYVESPSSPRSSCGSASSSHSTSGA